MDIKISVCIITRNEEKLLPACLKSVQPCSDEIVIVDTGSQDGTVELAEKFGCKVIQIEWNDDFSFARNKGLDEAKYPYILIIDADERILNPELVKTTLKKSKAETGGWLIKIVSEARRTDGGVDTYVSSLLRLFRNKPGIRFNGIIHEQVLEQLLSSGYRLENTPVELVHLGYGFSPGEMKKKQERNLALLNKAIENKKGDAYMIYQRAKTYLALKNLEKAEDDIKLCLDTVNPNSAVKPQALNFGAVIAFQSEKYELAIERAKESLKIVPNQAFANYILGDTYSQKGNFPDALDAYERMDDISKTGDVTALIVGDYNLPPEQLHFRKGKCLIGLKQFDVALKEFEKGYKLNPNDVGCIVGLANVAFQWKKFDEAESLLERAIILEPAREDIKNYMNQVNDAIQKINGFEKKKSNDILFGQQDKIKPFLTLSMIVKNEEEQLPGCLDSVSGIADEIVIVDTGSTDKTRDIARHYNAKIFDYVWSDDFAAARNEALKHSTGHWILYLDADERLDKRTSMLVKPLLESSADDTGGFICTIESDHSQLDGSKEHHRGGYPRIFRNYGFPGIFFQGRVHEQITPSIFALGKS